MTKAAVLPFPATEPLQLFRNGSSVPLTPKVQAIIEMIVEHGAAVEAVEHGTIEVHCHPNEWVLQVYHRTGKAFRKGLSE